MPSTGALEASAAAGLPAISVSPLQGKFLHILARLMGARRVLEIGSLGGYSAIWLGRALPAAARGQARQPGSRTPATPRSPGRNIADAGLSGTVGGGRRRRPSTRCRRLARELGPASFDLTFIDADKPNNPAYFDWALQLTRPGGAIVVDNVVQGGPGGRGRRARTRSVVGTRQLFDSHAPSTPGVAATALQTVGVKGYDGFAIAIVRGTRSSGP